MHKPQRFKNNSLTKKMTEEKINSFLEDLEGQGTQKN